MAADSLTVSVRGLEVFGRHGVFEAERTLGQRFVVDLDIELADSRSASSDRLADTVDYGALVDSIAEIVAGEPVSLLEHLAGLIADRALAQTNARGVLVRVHKPHVALAQSVAETAVTLHRTRT